MTPARTLAFSGAALAVLAATSGASADPLKLEPGKPLEIACDTKSVVVATDAANATSGAIRLKLEPAADNPKIGKWSILGADDPHKGSFAVSNRDTCTKGCPMTVSATNEAQLWAPEAKTIDKLGDKETLLIAVIKPDTFALRASTFRGKDIEALEEGHCRPAP